MCGYWYSTIAKASNRNRGWIMTLEDSFAEYLYAHEEQETCHIPRNNEYHVPQEKRGFKNIVTNWNSTNN